MNIDELEATMSQYGMVIRAIPEKIRGVYEVSHQDLFPNGQIMYLEEYKREMLVVETRPQHAGKFVIECARHTYSRVQFNGKKFYDTISEAVNDVLRQKKEDS